MRARHRRQPPPRLSAFFAAAALGVGSVPATAVAQPSSTSTASVSPVASPTDSITTQAQAAKQRYASGDFIGAARAYEALWNTSRAAKYLYNAGMAREAAGQRGLAVRHWRRFLAADSELTPAEQAELRVRAKDVAAENPVLEVRLEPSSALGPATKLTLLPPSELVAAGLTPIDLRDPIAGEVAVAVAHFKTSLDPGTWTLSITGLRGAADQKLAVAVSVVPVEDPASV